MRGTFVEGAPSRPDADDLPRLEDESKVDSRTSSNWGGTPGLSAAPRTRIAGPATDFFPPGKGAPAGHGRARLVVVALVAILVIAAIGIWAMVGGSKSAAPASPAVTVASSARSAIAAGTAHLSVDMALVIPGTGRVTATGTGAVDVNHSASQMNLSFSGSGGLHGAKLRIDEPGPAYTGVGVQLQLGQAVVLLGRP